VINTSRAGETNEAAAAEAVETGAAERKQPDGKQSRTIKARQGEAAEEQQNYYRKCLFIFE